MDREWYSGSQDRAVGVTKLPFWLECMLSRIQKRLGLTGALLRALAILSFVVGTACQVNAASTPAQYSSGSSIGVTSYFAIADFDGDQKPDLATVELQTSTSAKTTRYSIRLRLATGATQLFGVTAPAGGLQIMAQDVNGDSALDVLVSSAWLHKQVAVLLNDGHGKFTLADPGAFPAAIQEDGTRWNSGSIALCDNAVLVRPGYSSGEIECVGTFDGPQRQFGRAYAPVFPSFTRLPLLQLLGRAPPLFVFQS